MGFLRQDNDGSTSLAILVPSNGTNVGPEIPINLGAFTGKIAQGTTVIQGAREDRKNFHRPSK